MKPPGLTALIPLLACFSCVSTVVSPAQDWQPSGPSGPWSRIACSADGIRVMAVGENPSFPCANGIQASTNSGGVWFGASVYAGVDVAGTADGTVWIVADANCNDLLFPWAVSGSPVPNVLNTSSSVVALSSDGSRLLAAGLAYGVFVSTDSGVTWQSLLGDVAVTSLACSADGATIVAASPSNAVYTSTDFGADWSTNIVDTQWPGPWNSVACCPDASRIFAASGDGVFVSTNAGIAWAQIHPADSFQSVAVSADGAQIAAAVRAGLIYTSTNSGLNWSLDGLGDLSALGNTNDIVTAVAMSADGSIQFAAPQGGNVYARQTSPPPLLKMSSSGTNLTFSWPFPSVHFVLEQTTNPQTNLWQYAAATPVASYSTLRNTASIPTPTQSVFFRLAAYLPLQSSYNDLDFESATIYAVRNDPYNRINSFNAFPGWTAYSGTGIDFYAFFNSVSTNYAGIGLQTNSSGQFDGKFYATIQSGFAITGGSPRPVQTTYLSQTGLVPTNAQSLLFKAAGSRYVVSLSGQALNLNSLGANVYGANVTRFRGTSAELRFTVLTNLPPQPPLNTLYLDSISFSTRPVP